MPKDKQLRSKTVLELKDNWLRRGNELKYEKYMNDNYFVIKPLQDCIDLEDT